MRKNLIVFSGLSHSGKDLLFGQIMKLGKLEPNLKIQENVIYYEWIINKPKKDDESYIDGLFPALQEKILMKLNTLIYIHDISYQLLNDIVEDFQHIISSIQAANKNFKVVLLLNRGHLITNEIERERIKKEVLERLQQIYPHEIGTYIVSLKGIDEQRLTNLVFAQIVNKASVFEKELQEKFLEKKPILSESEQNKIRMFLTKKMNDLGFAGAYLLLKKQEILLAIGKSKSWEEKLGPQIIRMLDNNDAFEISPKTKTNILRIEDFLMVTQAVSTELKLVLIGRESTFKLNSETYSDIERICYEIAGNINPKAN